jgi:predicted acylesterase/phospholipase RssA
MKRFKALLPAFSRSTESPSAVKEKLGLVLSGGGSRAAYQVGVLRAVERHLASQTSTLSVVIGSSIGAINTLILASALNGGLSNSIDFLEQLWLCRKYGNTFRGSPSSSFIKALQIAILRYKSPGPVPTSVSIFDPHPLQEQVASVIASNGAITPNNLAADLKAVAVMATLEAIKRKPLLLACAQEPLGPEGLAGSSFDVMFLSNLTATHAMASAALPSVLPAVDLDLESHQVRLIDGGICDNIPIDPARRLGAENIIVIDSSGRKWWYDHYGTPLDEKPDWEIAAKEGSYCLVPKQLTTCRNSKPLGPLLRHSVGKSSRDFISALGPTWPIFRILKYKMGEELAYEVMSYVALHPDYVSALLELGYQDGLEMINRLGNRPA